MVVELSNSWRSFDDHCLDLWLFFSEHIERLSLQNIARHKHEHVFTFQLHGAQHVAPTKHRVNMIHSDCIFSSTSQTRLLRP